MERCGYIWEVLGNRGERAEGRSTREGRVGATEWRVNHDERYLCLFDRRSSE